MTCFLMDLRVLGYHECDLTIFENYLSVFMGHKFCDHSYPRTNMWNFITLPIKLDLDISLCWLHFAIYSPIFGAAILSFTIFARVTCRHLLDGIAPKLISKIIFFWKYALIQFWLWSLNEGSLIFYSEKGL